MADNLLVVHGGGPTAVINASLYGVIREAKKNPSIGKVLGAIGGTGAIFTEQFLDLTAFSDEKLKLLLHTPASAIGSSRYPLYEEDYAKMPEIFKKHHIGYVLLNGGNGTMDACEHIYEVCRDHGIGVAGIMAVPPDIWQQRHRKSERMLSHFQSMSVSLRPWEEMPDGSLQHQPLQDVRKVMHRI